MKSKTWAQLEREKKAELSTSDSLGLGTALVILLVAAFLR